MTVWRTISTGRCSSGSSSTGREAPDFYRRSPGKIRFFAGGREEIYDDTHADSKPFCFRFAD
jgi:hypothetical protein